jgi:hypothetical protein
LDSTEEYEEVPTLLSNIWKCSGYYYKQLDDMTRLKYLVLMNHLPPQLDIQFEEDYLLRMRDCGSMITKEDIKEEEHTVDIFIQLVEQLQRVYDNTEYCHTDVRVPNIVYNKYNGSPIVTLVDWDFATLIYGFFRRNTYHSFYPSDRVVTPLWDIYSLGCLAFWAQDSVEDRANYYFEWQNVENVESNTLQILAGIFFKKYDMMKTSKNEIRINKFDYSPLLESLANLKVKRKK